MKDIGTIISMCMSVILFLISIFNFYSSRKLKMTTDVEQQVKVNMKLDEICRTTTETRTDIKAVKLDVQNIREEQIKQKMQIDALWREVDTIKKAGVTSANL